MTISEELEKDIKKTMAVQRLILTDTLRTRAPNMAMFDPNASPEEKRKSEKELYLGAGIIGASVGGLAVAPAVAGALGLGAAATGAGAATVAGTAGGLGTTATAGTMSYMSIMKFIFLNQLASTATGQVGDQIRAYMEFGEGRYSSLLAMWEVIPDDAMTVNSKGKPVKMADTLLQAAKDAMSETIGLPDDVKASIIATSNENRMANMALIRQMPADYPIKPGLTKLGAAKEYQKGQEETSKQIENIKLNMAQLAAEFTRQTGKPVAENFLREEAYRGNETAKQLLAVRAEEQGVFRTTGRVATAGTGEKKIPGVLAKKTPAEQAAKASFANLPAPGQTASPISKDLLERQLGMSMTQAQYLKELRKRGLR